ncbi:MAG: NADH-quinone oxidoreductase subunit NuoE family protein [Tissierella sp.]|uniref:NADH-quinone oxidoreductase subunit NuoE family protein n=1 Tax=Tissierella sp. TaxID=41274 RepID=UPI003F9B1EB2
MIIKEKENYESIKEFLDEAESSADLIEVLHKTQDLYGYIPKRSVTKIAKTLDIPVSIIYGVITFYSRFSLIPKGKYSVSVCMGTACYVKGANDVLEEFSRKLGIGVGETTEDQLFSIIETRCVGECALAPVVNINEDVYPFFKLEDVENIINKLKAGEKDDK